ncbi:hypothetical protein PTSG_05980 [Salpingoeca rosetta]|uniref:EF-hand domain-containing protein n=1 Tax=Salpingoeca rosetta (strain ATCC 50818 / BSB-021) TaxID=946362 RepID=F2UDC1_SALR5|nr:uncharacterized protein PTSG_05980 [Salpingoeca rosetta]EGD74616.1 hypothetical protein PTSG_05980 [Salpingoeca rosetta]|eukprot:XP_004992873.1 hypothetical protein PTSG_05980 [Salpingoeca rosetta]
MSAGEDKVKAKLRELGTRSQDEQANFFVRAFGNSISPTEVAAVAKQFDAITGKQKAKEIEEPQALKLLTEEGRTLTLVEFRKAFRSIDVDCNGRLSLTEFLLFKYNKRAPELFQDRGENDLVAQLDKAEQLEEHMAALKLQRENKIKELQERIAIGGVKGMRAKHELEALLASDDSQLKEQEMHARSIKQRAEKAVTDHDPFEAQKQALKNEEEQRKREEMARRKQSAERLRAKGAAFGL